MSDLSQSITCPRDGTSLFIDMSEFYCWECETFYCPVCMSPWDVVATPEVVCVHYVADYFAGLDAHGDYHDRARGLLPFGGWFEGPDAPEPEPLLTIASMIDNSDEAGSEAVEAILAGLSDADRTRLFGDLYEWSQDDFGFDFKMLCDALHVPLVQAYRNESAYTTVHFSPLGGDQAWEILRQALEKHKAGMAWLTEQLM